MSSKKRNGYFDYVSKKQVKAWKKRGDKPSRIKMTLKVIEMNKEILKNVRNI